MILQEDDLIQFPAIKAPEEEPNASFAKLEFTLPKYDLYQGSVSEDDQDMADFQYHVDHADEPAEPLESVLKELGLDE